MHPTAHACNHVLLGFPVLDVGFQNILLNKNAETHKKRVEVLHMCPKPPQINISSVHKVQKGLKAPDFKRNILG